jgi:hypothetical protein
MSEQPEENAEELEDGGEFGLDLRSQIFLTMRQQNLTLLKIAADVAGFSKGPGPLRPEDTRKALKTMWEIYSEIYSWVDPEESEDDEDEDEE